MSFNSNYYPLDEEEAKPDYEHQALTLMLGGLVPPQSLASLILSREDGGAPLRIMDAGTGTGAWAVDIAEKYPSAQVLAFDLSPINPSEKPPNCNFEVNDAFESLDDYSGYDLIHARSLLQSCPNYEKFFADVAKALNPGGVFISIEGSIELYNKDKLKYQPQEKGHPDFCAANELRKTFLENLAPEFLPRFSDVDKVYQIIQNTPGRPWTSIRRTDFFLPLGDFNLPDPTEREAGELMKRLIPETPKIFESYLVYLCRMEKEYAELLAQEALVEMGAQKKVNYTKWNVVCAMKADK